MASVPDRKTIAAWSLYDFANSSFTTIVVTFIYATYFTEKIATDSLTGASQWGYALSASAVLVAVMSPFLGAVADSGGHRKKFLFISTVMCILGSVVLFFPLPGQVAFALGTFVLANVAFEMANVFYNAYLPDIAPADQIGRISGLGWGLGYFGGVLTLVIGYLLLVAPDPALFGLSSEGGSSIRATSLLVAIWFSVFSIPMFLWVKDPDQLEKPPKMSVLLGKARAELVQTFHEIRKFRSMFRFLVARLVYNDGLITVFGFAAIYAADQFGVNPFVLGITLNVVAGLGAFGMGYVDDIIGGKKTILITLVGLSLAVFAIILTSNIIVFWASAALIALLAGPNQAASRSLFARFVPEDRENEFFGFFAFSGKFTAFLGPILLAQMITAFQSQRAGISVVIILFVMGGLLLLRVNEQDGIEASGRKYYGDQLG
jgi:UMF1 family MFS transporter